MAKPWANEFPVDRPDDMDPAARRILIENMRAGETPDPGFKPLARGAAVEFLRQGAWQRAKIVAVHLDPNRKPGIGRVSYDVETHPMFHPIRVAAKNVRAA